MTNGISKENIKNSYLERILNSSTEGLRHMENVDGVVLNKKNYLGAMDADTEWNHNPNEAREKFLHTEAYERFLDEQSIILLGRTGTGKTAIFRCIEEDVRQKKLNRYSHVVKIFFSDILGELNNSVKIDATQNTFINIKRVLETIINIEVMKYLYENDCNRCHEIKDYLDAKGIIQKNRASHWVHTIATQTKEFKGDNERTIAIANLSGLFLALTSGGHYEKAYKEMLNITQNEKVLVLIDTMDYYDINDRNVIIPVKALVGVCFNFYNMNRHTNIHVNIALPSEVYSHILYELPGKQQGNTVIIQWRFKNLLNFIAIRLYDWCKKERKEETLNFLGNYDITDFRGENCNRAHEFLYHIFPEYCCTSLDFMFPMLPYCIRHTMKKPRELMLIFDVFVEKIVESGNLYYFKDNPNDIKKYIHSTQQEMIASALSMYATMYPNIDNICQRVLGNKKFLFVEKDIEKNVREIAKPLQMSGDEIKRILFESGLVGVMNTIENGKLEVPNCEERMEVTHISARFEYQIKGKLGFNKEDYYVIHPMCYEHFTCYLDPRTLVYPSTDGDDSDVLQMFLKDEGI